MAEPLFLLCTSWQHVDLFRHFLCVQVAIPAVSDDAVVTEWSELDGGSASHHSTNSHSKAIERVKNRDYDGSLYMVNKPPRWNDQVMCLCA